MCVIGEVLSSQSIEIDKIGLMVVSYLTWFKTYYTQKKLYDNIYKNMEKI